MHGVIILKMFYKTVDDKTTGRLVNIHLLCFSRNISTLNMLVSACYLLTFCLCCHSVLTKTTLGCSVSGFTPRRNQQPERKFWNPFRPSDLCER